MLEIYLFKVKQKTKSKRMHIQDRYRPTSRIRLNRTIDKLKLVAFSDFTGFKTLICINKLCFFMRININR